jgi:hypothetical protein
MSAGTFLRLNVPVVPKKKKIDSSVHYVCDRTMSLKWVDLKIAVPLSGGGGGGLQPKPFQGEQVPPKVETGARTYISKELDFLADCREFL